MRKVYTLFLMVIITTLSFGQNVGDIIITEIMQNPDAVSDANGEWFELYNTTSSDIDINGWTIADDDKWDEADEGKNEGFVISGELIIPANSYIFLSNNNDDGTNGGLPTPDYTYNYSTTDKSGVKLGNGTDGLKLIYNGIVIDSVRWDGGKVFPFPSGQTMTLRDDKLNGDDNLFGYNWCSGTTVYGDGDKGTPGEQNDKCVACVAEGAVIFTEIMQNPKSVADEKGEWFEIYNTTDSDISLKNWRVIDDNKTEEGYKIDTLVDGTEAIIKAKSFLIFCVNKDNASNGGLNPDVLYKYKDLTLGNGTDGIMLYCRANFVDKVVWDDGTSFPDPNGASMSLFFDKSDGISNDDGINWYEETTSYGDGDFGTPGARNDQALSNEINEVEGFSIYPNPVTSGSFVVTSSDMREKEISLYNVLGSEVFRQTFNSDRLEINTSSFESGMYFVRVVEGRNVSVQKLVIQ